MILTIMIIIKFYSVSYNIIYCNIVIFNISLNSCLTIGKICRISSVTNTPQRDMASTICYCIISIIKTIYKINIIIIFIIYIIICYNTFNIIIKKAMKQLYNALKGRFLYFLFFFLAFFFFFSFFFFFLCVTFFLFLFSVLFLFSFFVLFFSFFQSRNGWNVCLGIRFLSCCLVGLNLRFGVCGQDLLVFFVRILYMVLVLLLNK